MHAASEGASLFIYVLLRLIAIWRQTGIDARARRNAITLQYATDAIRWDSRRSVKLTNGIWALVHRSRRRGGCWLEKAGDGRCNKQLTDYRVAMVDVGSRQR